MGYEHSGSEITLVWKLGAQRTKLEHSASKVSNDFLRQILAQILKFLPYTYFSIFDTFNSLSLKTGMIEEQACGKTEKRKLTLALTACLPPSQT